jgi:hypothetical protein
MPTLKIVHGYYCDEGCQYIDLHLGKNVTARVSENTCYLVDELINGKCSIMVLEFTERCFEKLNISGMIAKSKNIIDSLRTLFVYDYSGKFKIVLDSRDVKKVEFDMDIEKSKDLRKVLWDCEFIDLVSQGLKANIEKNENEAPKDTIKIIHETGDEK